MNKMLDGMSTRIFNRAGEKVVEQDIEQDLKRMLTRMLNMTVEQIGERGIERILDGIFTKMLKREVQEGFERYVGQYVQLQIIRQEMSLVELQNTTISPLTSLIHS